jgi:hypothetical protein
LAASDQNPPYPLCAKSARENLWTQPKFKPILPLFGTSCGIRSFAVLFSDVGKTITSVIDMVSYAGDLRRAAKQTTAPELADKIQRAAAQIEKTGLAKVGQAGPGIGALLDTFV